jgi:type VI secretion system protein
MNIRVNNLRGKSLIKFSCPKICNLKYMPRGHHLPRLVFIFAGGVLALSFATACVPKAVRPASRLVVKVDISPRANNNNPVALDLVLVKNKTLFKELMKLSAGEWFEKRQQYRLDYPKETGLSTGSWEWVPGQVVTIDPMSFKDKFAGGLVFANYFTPGTHRAVINPTKPVVITLGAEEMVVTPEK